MVQVRGKEVAPAREGEGAGAVGKVAGALARQLSQKPSGESASTGHTEE